jgi:RNA polymerase sigma-70 factor (ECF subfamily)
MSAAAIAIPMGDFPRKTSMAQDDPDLALIVRCRAGEAAALHEVYRRHRSAVYGVASRMIANQADREEIVQDVFLEVFRSLVGFRGTSRLSTWIRRVTVNVILQHIRRKGRRVSLRLVDEPPEQIALDPDTARPATPEADALRRERREAVERALAKLSPKKRIALVLADLEGLSSVEVAEAVGAPALTVRTRLFYARRDFYAALAVEPAFDDLVGRGGLR